MSANSEQICFGLCVRFLQSQSFWEFLSLIQLLSIGLSKEISNSIQKFVVAQTTWTASFFAGAYIFLRPGRFKRWAMIMWAMAIFVSLIAIWEFRVGHVVWLGHIPSFLKVDDDAVQAILAGNMRAGTNLYRAQSTFSTPLGLAEYLALTVPFVMHFATRRFSRNIRIAALVSLPIILYACVLTNAKLGTIGSLASIMLYVFGVSFQYWRRDKGSLVAAASLLFYPLLTGLVGGAMLVSHRFSVLIFGNDGSHAASTEGRIEQYITGFHKFLEWPFGYGIGMGASTLGFTGVFFQSIPIICRSCWNMASPVLLSIMVCLLSPSTRLHGEAYSHRRRLKIGHLFCRLGLP